MTIHLQTEADVVVVGGGGSGLIAAAQARRLGSSVIVLEKANVVGGTTALSVGSIMASGSRLQKRAGITDSACEHAEDLAAVCGRFGLSDNAELRQLFADHAREAVDFLEDIGVVFTSPMMQPPHRKARLHQIIPAARSYIFHLQNHCLSAGVKILTGQRARRFILEGRRVVGVEAEGTGGKVFRVMARRGVVLASGDVSGNPELLKQYAADGLQNVELMNPVCTGDGHLMAEEVGARILPRRDFGAAGLAVMRFVPPMHKNLVQRIPPNTSLARLSKWAMEVLPSAILRPFILKFVTTALGPDRGLFEHGAILVNKRGERFADELGGPNINDVTRHESKGRTEQTAPSLLLADQPQGIAYVVLDGRLAEQFSAWPHFVSTAPGVAYAYVDDYRKTRKDIFHSAPTPEALAAKLRFDTSRFVDTISATTVRSDSKKGLQKPPYFALGPVKAWILVTPVGVAVNNRLQVLDRTDEPIPGLFAAGGVGQGGFTITGHGHGLGWAFTTGLLAGRHAAQKV